MRILVARPDRMGDVVLSTPVLEAIRRALPGAEITFLVKKMLAPLFENHPYLDDLLLYDPDFEHRGVNGILTLRDQLVRKKYDVALNLFADFSVVSAEWLAKIPRRVGPRSKWFTYLLLTESIRQKRSQVLKHEAEYNLELLRLLGQKDKQFDISLDQISSWCLTPTVSVNEQARSEISLYIKSLGISSREPLILVHPGMGGSALNWPEKSYVELIKLLVEQKGNVILTGSVVEKPLLERIIKQIKSGKKSKFLLNTFIGELNDKGLSKLVALISQANLLIAPSTGPLHLASALNIPIVSFYPPIKVQSKKRWGPYSGGKENKNNQIWAPSVECPQVYRCAGSSCKFYFCMDKISVKDVFKSINLEVRT